MDDTASTIDDQLVVNRAHWDEMAELHRVSYDAATLVADPLDMLRQPE